MALSCFIVIRKRAVKWIQSRRELYGNIIAAMGRIRIINAAVVFSPVRIPGAYPVGHWILRCGFLANPEDGSHDFFFPRETLSRLGRIFSQLPRSERERTHIERTIFSRFLRFFAELC